MGLALSITLMVVGIVLLAVVYPMALRRYNNMTPKPPKKPASLMLWLWLGIIFFFVGLIWMLIALNQKKKQKMKLLRQQPQSLAQQVAAQATQKGLGLQPTATTLRAQQAVSARPGLAAQQLGYQPAPAQLGLQPARLAGI